MFKKNKKIFKFLIGALILNLPATLKVSAMENNQNLQTTIQTTEEKYEFSNDEYFNDILEDHINNEISTILVEDFRKYLLNAINYIKDLDEIHHYSHLFSDPDQKKLEKELYEKFKKYNENYIEKNIKLNKNLKVNFYYYKYLIYEIYDRVFYSMKHSITAKFYVYIKNNKNYLKIIDAITRHKEQLFDGISKVVKKMINTNKYHNNKKYFNIPKEYETFEEYLKKNPKIAIEDVKDDMHDYIEEAVRFHCIYNVIRDNLEKIYEIEGIED